MIKDKRTYIKEQFAKACEGDGEVKKLDFISGELKDTNVELICTCLRQNTVVTELYLGRNDITDYGCLLLGELLMVNTTLTLLDLSLNKFKDEGVKHLSWGLKANRSLRRLNLQNLSLGAESMVALTRAVGMNTTLRSLSVSYNPDICTGSGSVGRLLRIGTNLRKLNLSGVNMSIRTFYEIDAGLPLVNNSTLTSLNLNAAITDPVISYDIVRQLHHNHSLTVLDFQFCHVNNRVARVLGEMLLVNSTLEVLDITNNREMTFVGAAYIGDALRHNTTLRSLHINHWDITGESKRVFNESMMENSTLTTFNWNCIGNTPYQSLVRSANRNKTLYQLVMDVWRYYIVQEKEEETNAKRQRLK